VAEPLPKRVPPSKKTPRTTTVAGK
jgi:hypothetical protein